MGRVWGRSTDGRSGQGREGGGKGKRKAGTDREGEVKSKGRRAYGRSGLGSWLRWSFPALASWWDGVGRKSSAGRRLLSDLVDGKGSSNACEGEGERQA